MAMKIQVNHTHLTNMKSYFGVCIKWKAQMWQSFHTDTAAMPLVTRYTDVDCTYMTNGELLKSD